MKTKLENVLLSRRVIPEKMDEHKSRGIGLEYPVSFNSTEIEYVLEEAVNYLVIPSLEKMALVRIVVKLWREVDRRSFRRWRRNMDFTDRENFEETVLEIKEKVYLLGLPMAIERKIMDLVKPIGEHIWEWRMECYFKDYDVNSIQSIDILMWTYRGAINRSKTTAAQIAKNRIVHKLYAKACYYCIEDQIFKLWGELLEYEKDLYCNKIIEDTGHGCFEVYWTCVVNNNLSKLPPMLKDLFDERVNWQESIHEIMMMVSVILGNSSAVTYFWYKLTEGEKSKNLTTYAEVAFDYYRIKEFSYKDGKEYTDIVCLLLSYMDMDQQKHIFKNYSKSLLEMLITSWPWQEFLVPTISLMWDFLDINVYAYLISVIVRCIHGEMKNDVRIVEESHLWQLWRSTPIAIKKEFFQCVAGNVGHLNGIFKGKKFESAWILLSEVLLRQNVEPDTFRDCQFIYKSLNRRNSENHVLRF